MQVSGTPEYSHGWAAAALRIFPEVIIPSSSDTGKLALKQNTVLFNSMIAPIIGYGIKGFIWYQGESNGLEPGLYEKLFPVMVLDWRKQWGSVDLPFYYVQVAPFAGPVGQGGNIRGEARIRKAQFKSMAYILIVKWFQFLMQEQNM